MTGEPWVYTNWIRASNEPNNDTFYGPENYTHFKLFDPGEPARWNDIVDFHPVESGRGYVVEYE